MTPLQLRARDVVRAIPYLTLATTCEDGSSWNSPVFTAYDASGTFYWESSPQSVHSRNVARTGRAFAVIYDSSSPTHRST